MTLKAFSVLVIFALVLLGFVSSNVAEPSAESYWKTKVGNIPIPKTLKDSLQLGSIHGMVKLNKNYQHYSANQYQKYTPYNHPADSKDELLMSTHPTNSEDERLHPAIDDCVFHWGNHVSKSQIPQDGRTVYFTDDTISTPGKKMKLHFKKTDKETKFLPLNIVKSMPSTSDKLPVILNLLSINPNSILAQDIEVTMKKCEEKGVKDEKRHCATSLEDMVDYVASVLKSRKPNLMAVSTMQDNGKFMEYTIEKAQKLGSDDNHNMVCHKMNNPYVVFLCHDIKSTDLYGVSLVGANGEQTKAVAVCHKDTSSWSTNHYAFEFLDSKPGGKPVCHFLSADAVVWFRN